MLSADNPLRLSRALVDADIREFPGIAPYYAVAEKLGKIVIVEEKGEQHAVNNIKKN